MCANPCGGLSSRETQSFFCLIFVSQVDQNPSLSLSVDHFPTLLLIIVHHTIFVDHRPSNMEVDPIPSLVLIKLCAPETLIENQPGLFDTNGFLFCLKSKLGLKKFPLPSLSFLTLTSGIHL